MATLHHEMFRMVKQRKKSEPSIVESNRNRPAGRTFAFALPVLFVRFFCLLMPCVAFPLDLTSLTAKHVRPDSQGATENFPHPVPDERSSRPTVYQSRANLNHPIDDNSY